MAAVKRIFFIVVLSGLQKILGLGGVIGHPTDKVGLLDGREKRRTPFYEARRFIWAFH
jgi:hypothetical protein